MTSLLKLLVLSLLVFNLSGCEDNILTSSENSSVGGVFDNDSGPAPTEATAIVLEAGAFEFNNGTYALNCEDYISSGLYAGEGDGLYRIDSDGDSGNAEYIVHCDMTTDGGGWTLVGRGRENWNWTNSGENTADVSNNVGTVGAFTPSYHPASRVNELVGGVDFSTLADGLRVKRASNIAGTAYQECRWKFGAAQTSFSWLFDTSLPLSNYIINGVDYGARNTANSVPTGNNQNRTWTFKWPGKGNIRGFNYGSSVHGVNNDDPNTFMWERTTEAHAAPYTEVYVRE